MSGTLRIGEVGLRACRLLADGRVGWELLAVGVGQDCLD